MEENVLKEAFQIAEKLEKEGGNPQEVIGSYSKFIDSCQTFLNVKKLENEWKESKLNVDEMRGLLARAYNNRGYQKYRQVDFDEAVEDYTIGLSYNDNMYYSYYNRGLIHYRLARFTQAIEDMKKALEIKPDFEPAQKCLKQSLKDYQVKLICLHHD